MFAPVLLISAALFSTFTFQNGIRLTEAPGDGKFLEVVIGYRTGGLPELVSTSAARTLIVSATSAGGAVDLIQEIDRTALRLLVPEWSRPIFVASLAEFFEEIPHRDRVFSTPAATFKERVELEIREALLGSRSAAPDYGTDLAFLAMSTPVSEDLKQRLAAIPARASRTLGEAAARLPAERTMRFLSSQPDGAVIFAVPVPAVYYKDWYSVLLLDRLLHRVLPAKPSTSLPLVLHPFYYRLELTVPAGQFPEPLEQSLLQEIQRLQFSRATPADLEAARHEAMQYLDSKQVRDWFASHGIPEHREEGVRWTRSFSADDMRIATRDLLLANRVIATWAPDIKQRTVEIEPLEQIVEVGRRTSADSGAAMPIQASPIDPVTLREFPAHAHVQQPTRAPEKLASGVTMVESTRHAVFVSGRELTLLDRVPDAKTLTSYVQYRPDRILVLTPAEDLERVRQLWGRFQGNLEDGTFVVPQGSVSSGDLPALTIIKAFLERRTIESGLWPGVSVEIDAAKGSALHIAGPDADRASLMSWIRSMDFSDFEWAREVAEHQLPATLPHLQALTWQRDPLGVVQSIETVSLRQVQDVAQVYFK